ncbi:hypothetical protein H634G_10681 [Metarhizium anisopliae BRIP 53293]|uniref:Gfo/Idh/MocA-like oxidoreductase N-terminal domain-containing protein n=1 Tax=Metarhizium anisopliae BRIP 53293 TaxID=1291518 RepID=A0A0D9NN54_METAN|nr:hypothetical protein H634G_10681 [Metarhizium anisopliae BRIP 53293]KJK91509.1 hypothetical protein H633G_04607 [Metarhizium anisopliae BRIP 53284]
MAFGRSISAAPIAVISAGIIGPQHAKTVMKNNEAKLVAVVDSSPAGSALATELSVSNYTGVDNLLNSAEQVDVAIICTPNHTHVHLATKFASRVIHMMVEKPVSADVRSGQDLVLGQEQSPGRASSSVQPLYPANETSHIYRKDG